MIFKLITAIILTSTLGFAGNLEGFWSFTTMTCKSGAAVSPFAYQFFKNSYILYKQGTMTQTIPISPDCIFSLTGPYSLNGDLLEMGLLKAAKSSTCPPGISITDSSPKNAKIEIDTNTMTVSTLAGAVCTVANDVLVTSYFRSQLRRYK